MRRVAVVTLWDGPRTVAALSDDGRPTTDLLKAAGLRLRGPWDAEAFYVVGDAVTHLGTLYRTATDGRAGTPGVDPAWLALMEADVLELVADQWTAQNDGVRPVARALEEASLPRARGVAGASDPAGSVPR